MSVTVNGRSVVRWRGECKLVLLHLVRLGYQALLLGSKLHLGAQNVNPGDRAGALLVGCPVKKSLCGGYFRGDRSDARGVGNHGEIGIADSLHHQITGIIRPDFAAFALSPADLRFFSEGRS